MKNLKILALGRNLIKSFAGLEPLGDTLEELWISYNLIEKMKGINAMKNLRVLYMSNNLVKDWHEFNRLQELTNLRDLLFVGNPLYENLEVISFFMNQEFIGYVQKSTNLSLRVLKSFCSIEEDWRKIHNDIWFNFQVEIWKSEVAKRLPMLEKLDGELIIRTEENEALLHLDSPVQIWGLMNCL